MVTLDTPRDPLTPYALDLHCLRTTGQDGQDTIVAISWTAQYIDQARSERMYRKFFATETHGVDLVRRGRGWAKEREYIGAMDFVAERGDLGLLQAMHQDIEYKWSCTPRAMDRAAATGHLHVLAWLGENCIEGCTIDALNGAARGGHVAILQWLHGHEKLTPTIDAFLAALEGGHMEAVLWVTTTAPSLMSSSSCSHAKLVDAACVSSNRLAVLQWLEDTKDVRFVNGSAVALVLSENDNETAQWLADPSGGDKNIKQWNWVVAKWFSYKFMLWHHDTIAKAALNGHASMVTWLAKAGPLHKVRRDTLWKCAMRGHLDVVELLLKMQVHLPKEVEFLPSSCDSFLDAMDDKHILGARRWEWYPLACDPSWAKRYVELWLEHRPDPCSKMAWLPRWARACGHHELRERLGHL